MAASRFRTSPPTAPLPRRCKPSSKKPSTIWHRERSLCPPARSIPGYVNLRPGARPPRRPAPGVGMGRAMLAKGPRLRLNEITKTFGDLAAIDNVDIELYRGEIH